MDGSARQTELGDDASLAEADPGPAHRAPFCLDRPHPLVRCLSLSLFSLVAADAATRTLIQALLLRPKAREYLISHPEITLDDFAATYSTSFFVSWPYDPSHVLITTPGTDAGNESISTNPVYEEHMRHLKNWSVGQAFRDRFPEIAKLTDEDADA